MVMMMLYSVEELRLIKMNVRRSILVSLAIWRRKRLFKQGSQGAHYCTLLSSACTLQTANCTLHTAHCTLQTAHCTLQTAHCTLHAALRQVLQFFFNFQPKTCQACPTHCKLAKLLREPEDCKCAHHITSHNTHITSLSHH